MIIIGALAKIKPPVYKKYIPNLETEAILESISSVFVPRPVTPIRALRSRGTRGAYYGARRPLSITFNFITNQTIARTYFTRVIEDLQKISGGIYMGDIDVFSENPFIPIGITSASWQQPPNNNPSRYSITMEYFHLDQEYSAGQPVEASFFDVTDSEHEIDLRTDEDIPVESFQYSINSQYEVIRTLDGYAGIRYNFINVVQSVDYYDDDYEFEYHFDPYIDEDRSLIERSSDISTGGKLLYKTIKTSPLTPSGDSLTIETIDIFNAST